MKKVLKKYFIPHQSNDHKPHFLRSRSLLVIASFLVLVELSVLANIFIIQKGSNFLAAVLPSVLVSYTNENRLAYNAPTLKTSPILERAAQLKADDMAKKGYFAHTSPEGLTPWYWFDEVGYKYLYAGENLAVNFIESKDVSDAWMNSPAHKDNIVNAHYTEIGIGTATGIYKGRETVFVAELFGTPAIPTALVQKSKAPAAAPKVAPSKVSQPVAVAPTPSVQILPQVKGEETTAIRGTKVVLEKIVASPKIPVTYVVGIILALLGVALFLAVFIKIKIQHPRMIAATIAVILITLSILSLNSYLFESSVEVPTSSLNASVVNTE